MAEVELSGVTQADVENGFLDQYRTTQGNPTATVSDMYASVMGRNLLKSVFDTFKAAYDLTINDVQSALSAINAKMAVGASYVSSSVMTTADLLANYPPSAATLGKYGRVSDLYGSVDEVLRCRFDGVNYRYVPQREAFTGTIAATTGTINIVPLVTPPTIRSTGTLVGSVNFLPSTVNAYVGQRQRIVVANTLGLFTATITGLIGSNISLLGGDSRTIEYGTTGWFPAN